ncbi:bifunctional adenosylcobinamide kinase/adenosylcobinamide-phosphate guanylyltransferase [Microbispora sp. RL4-1S]|uniref:Adenosylcobinamide kinase n=1 Tax=Microbispora oryzae TaxID=2806554 RepID=A0A940WJV8_9ACTN|nr:bifunctional adenosylcobinamide kinase/adenosylcobinamide-phosphate guanylyltransferase [Microbispora oryzae]MBP2702501.1 bifunctional adenosylcobinamide kinase/adenosylcobinamide-phosphate guanylyltransferase [Microbispora oryzae]
MEIFLEATGGPAGWPEPGCGCASCGRLTPGHRLPTSIVLDGLVRLSLDGGVLRRSSPAGAALPAAGGAGAHRHRIASGPDGHEITDPGGRRLLYATALPLAGAPSAGSPAAPASGPDGAPFDWVLIDLLDRPERLGDLRRRGRVGPATRVIAVHLDHRAASERELARRLELWGAEAVPDGTVLGPAVSGARTPPRRTLLLGGSRSGKSEEAELRLAGEPDVTYVATGPRAEGDPAWAERVRAHRVRRPAHWHTVETGDVTALLADPPSGALLIDGVGTWLTGVFDDCAAWPGVSGDLAGPAAAVAERCELLVSAWRRTAARVVAVSDEVGLGVVPATPAGRVFRDALGRLNQRLARESEAASLVVAGRLVDLPV